MEHLASSFTDTKSYHFAVSRAVNDPEFYKTFRQDDQMRKTYEHVTIEQGWRYLVEIQKADVKGVFDVNDLVPFHLLNDKVGGAESQNFGAIGMICPTTLRYVYTICDLIQKFGVEKLRNATIVEIGVGYGGLCRLIRNLFPHCQYHIVDLDTVCKLAHKFNNHDPKVKLLPYEDFESGNAPILPRIDLVISNYAWSECTASVRTLYFNRILQHANNGYMILNYLTTQEMENVAKQLQNSYLTEEKPDTNAGRNRLLVWSK